MTFFFLKYLSIMCPRAFAQAIILLISVNIAHVFCKIVFFALFNAQFTYYLLRELYPNYLLLFYSLILVEFQYNTDQNQ